MVADFFSHLWSEMTIALVFGLSAFVLHIIGYAWYSVETVLGRTRPNAASWFMWLIGAAVELYTYDGIEHHWSTSALPLACLMGVGIITVTTAMMQFRFWLKGGNGVIYEPSDRKDYYLVGADVGAVVLYFATGGAFWANFVAVSTSIVTFVPIWKTTLKHGHERPGPWIVWCFAYYTMFLAVLGEANPESFWEMSFYPLYYLVLHGVVALLAFRRIRVWLNRWRWPRTHLQPAE